MAITLELKLCLSNYSRGMKRKTEGNQSTNITLIFTSPVDLFLGQVSASSVDLFLGQVSASF